MALSSCIKKLLLRSIENVVFYPQYREITIIDHVIMALNPILKFFSAILWHPPRYRLKLCKRKTFHHLRERLDPVHKIGIFEVKFREKCHFDHVIWQLCLALGTNFGYEF